jgi:hypothetical protein
MPFMPAVSLNQWSGALPAAFRSRVVSENEDLGVLGHDVSLLCKALGAGEQNSRAATHHVS